MDLKNEIKSELAVAIIVEKRHDQKLDSQRVRALIDEIKDVFEQTTGDTSTEAGILQAAEAGASQAMAN